MSVSLKQVRAFVCLAQSANYAEAADKMCLSQPALSTSIQKLEQLVGGKLFIRTTRHLALSIEGQQFLPIAKRLLHDWDDALGDLNKLFVTGARKLNIAAMPSFASGLLGDLLYQFQRVSQADHPHSSANLNITVSDVVMEQVLSAVREGRAELGFTFEAQRMEGLEFHSMFSDAFIALLPSQHELVNKEQIVWADLALHSFVGMNRGSTIRNWLDAYQIEHGFSLNIVTEASQLATLGQFVKHGLGVSVVPALCEEQMSSRGVVCRPIADNHLQKRVGVVRKRRGSLSVSATAMWDWILSTYP